MLQILRRAVWRLTRSEDMSMTTIAALICAVGTARDCETAARIVATESAPGSAAGPGADFDFLHGDWIVSNRRLLGRLTGSNQWEAFESTNSTCPLAGSIGNIEEYRTRHWDGFVGLSLRFLEPSSGNWSIHWIDNRGAVLQPPVRGRFIDGIGTFEGADLLDGKPVQVRFIWSQTRSGAPRWEQAFSADAGRNWETNWTMQFNRKP